MSVIKWSGLIFKWCLNTVVMYFIFQSDISTAKTIFILTSMFITTTRFYSYEPEEE